MRSIPALAVCLAGLTGSLAAQDDQYQAVGRAALDYLEGFYEGDSTKLIRSVSTEVLKFGFARADDGSWQPGPRGRTLENHARALAGATGSEPAVKPHSAYDVPSTRIKGGQPTQSVAMRTVHLCLDR